MSTHLTLITWPNLMPVPLRRFLADVSVLPGVTVS